MVFIKINFLKIMDSKKIIINTVTSIIFFCFSAVYAQANFKVTLDAGHGDHDSGAHYHGFIEKEITLEIVLKVGKILENQPKIDVVYTRTSDVFIDLVERANIANRSKSNIFVSIHCNANVDNNAFGTETYVMGRGKSASNLEVAKRENSVITLEKDYKKKYVGFDPNNPETMFGMTLMQEEFEANSIALAGKIQDRFVRDLGRKSRGGGVKQERYMVLHKAYMPRVLIETGFISNLEEGDRLNSDEGQQEIAQAIANAIIDYKKEFFDFNEAEITPQSILKDSNKSNDKIFETKQSEPAKKQDLKAEPLGTLYKVQLSVSSKKLALLPKNFKGLNAISVSYEKNKFKYFYSESNNYEAAKVYLKTAKRAGFDSAFISAFKNGKSIDLNLAINQ